MSRPDVVVLGSLHLDIMVSAPGLPRLGETMAGSAWAQKPGGKGGNQAVAAARHGATVAMIGAVGTDGFATPLLDHLRAHGVDTGYVGIYAGGTGMSVALTEPSGDYAAVIVSGANLGLNAASVDAARTAIEGARWLLLQNEVPNAANLAAAGVARRAGCRVMLNAAPARTLPAALAQLVDVLVVNALEAEALAGMAVTNVADAACAASALLALVACAIVTAGGDGVAVAAGRGDARSLPALRVAVVSTHGAGDMFVGALAARLAAGDTLDMSLAYANAAAAALVSARDGALPGPANVWALTGSPPTPRA